MYESNNDYEPNFHYERINDVPPKPAGAGFAVASLVFGLISFFGLIMGASPITGTIATILGSAHLRRSRDKRLFAILGIVLGISGIIISFVLLNIVMSNLLPATENDIMDIYKVIEQYSV